jgi:hypothetical protein
MGRNVCKFLQNGYFPLWNMLVVNLKIFNRCIKKYLGIILEGQGGYSMMQDELDAVLLATVIELGIVGCLNICYCKPDTAALFQKFRTLRPDYLEVEI